MLHAGPYSLIVDCLPGIKINADLVNMGLNETFAWDQ